MNKLLTKIAGVALGLAMAIGVGVALSNNNGVRQAKADTVTMAYSGSTTTNMTGGNDAATLGLSATDWSVVGAKNSASNLPGLNKAGQIRLYYNASGSNTITVTSLQGWTINNITLSLGASNNNITVKVGASTITGKNNVYTIDSTSFVLGNGYTSNTQVYILSCVIDYSTGGGGGDPEPETITVSYDANGGTGTMAASTVTDGSVTLRTNTFTRSKYAFDGWNTEANGTGASYDDGATINSITESFTLYAQWDQTEFDVTYNANGGSGTMAASTSASNAASCTFVPPTNKIFNGWNTEANGTGASYAAGASLSAIAADTTLYAQWTNRPALSGSETLFYTLSCTNTLKNTDDTNNTSNTSYATYYNVVSGGVTWNAPGNQNNASYWRVGGGKNAELTNESKTIKNTTDVNSVDKPVTKIVLSHGGKSSDSLTVNYIQLEVGNLSFSSVTQTIKYTPTIAVSTSGSLEFYPSSNTLWEDGLYYRFTFNVSAPKGNNLGIDVNSIQFFYDYVSEDFATNLSVSPASLTPTKGANVLDTVSSDLTITAQKNGGSAAAYTNYSVSITRRDNSTETVTDSTVFTTGDKKLTITALDPTTKGGSTYESEEVSLSVSYTSVVTVGNKYALTATNTSNYVFIGTITDNRGNSSTYSNTPSDYAFVVEEGLYTGTVSFKLLSGTNADKYISWTGVSAQLAVSDSKTIQSSWVAFDYSGTTTITNASNETAQLMMNGNGNKFSAFTSLYQNYIAPSFLLLGTAKCDTFASTFMKMDSYDTNGEKGKQGEGNGSCSAYYPTAKAVYNGEATGDNAQYNLSGEERALICDTHGLYAGAYERLGEWARINGDSFNGSNLLAQAATNVVPFNNNVSNNSATIVILISLISVTALGGYVVIRRRKEDR